MRNQSGQAMLTSLFFVIVVGSLVTTGTMREREVAQRNDTNFRRDAQAWQFARSGLTEALSWLRRQTVQPVTAFEPRLDPRANPPQLDTDDPDIGLVREFQIAGLVWGRYEVWKQWDADPDSARLAWRRQMQAEDVGARRRWGTAGTAWRLRSIGYVFERRDANARFDAAPNRVLAVQKLECEVARRSIFLPGQAALTIAEGRRVTVNTGGRIDGGSAGAGIYYPTRTGSPTVGSPHARRVTGTPPWTAGEDVDVSMETVFGMSFAELRATADHFVSNAADFPETVADGATVVVDVPHLAFDRDRPLSGYGVVCMRGNVMVHDGSATNFRGVLYVDGNLHVRAPAEITGAVIVTGTVNVQGVGDYATLTYDDDLLVALRRDIGQYTLLGAIREIAAGE